MPKEIRIQAQPLIAVRDVAASSRWYQALLGCESAHGGDEYEMLVSSGKLVLQLHAWDLDEHANLVKPNSAPHGHGVLLWFETTDFDAAVQAAHVLRAEVVEEPHENPNSRKREIWLRDPDGYLVVLAGSDRRRG
jgi:catechol 2,3-dioxygenase-like lactoylglutathione lyase family enzyme